MGYDDNRNEDEHHSEPQVNNNQESGYDRKKASSDGEFSSERDAESSGSGGGDSKPRLRVKKKGGSAAAENARDNSANAPKEAHEKESEGPEESTPESDTERTEADKPGAHTSAGSDSAETAGEASGEASPQKKLRLARSPGSTWETEEQGSSVSDKEYKATYAAGKRKGGGESLLPEVVSIILFAAGNILTQFPAIRAVAKGGDFPVQEFGITGVLIVVFGLFTISRRGLLRAFSGILLLITIVWCGGVIMNAVSLPVPTIPAKVFGAGDMSQLPTLTVAAVALCIFIAALCLFTGGGKLRWSGAVIFVVAALAMPWLSLQEFAVNSEGDGDKTEETEQKEDFPTIGKEDWRELLPIRWEMKKADEEAETDREVALFSTSDDKLDLSINSFPSSKNDKSVREVAKEKYKDIQNRFPESRLAFIDVEGNDSCAKVSVYGSSRLEVFIVAIKGRHYWAELKGGKEGFSQHDSLIQETDSAFENAAEIFEGETESDQS